MKHNYIHIVYIKFNYDDNTKFIERLQLFDKYCIPSLLGQINQNFKAYININSKTKEFVNSYKNLYNNIEFTEETIDTIMSRYQNYDYIISSRVDTDDSLGIYYIDAVQKIFKLKLSKNNTF